MKRVYRLMILAIAGFGIGAGVALFQSSRENAPAETVIVQDQDGRAVETDLPTAVATQAAVELAMNNAAHDVTAANAANETAEADAHAGHDMPADAAGTEGETATEDHAAHDHAAMTAEQEAASAAPAPVAGSSVGGAFTLTDHNGVEVTDQSWPGQYKLVFFGFTHCPDICPAALDKMTAALNTLGDTAAKIQPVFITIDPARDDAATMKNYLASYHPSILGLTGTEEQIKQVEDAYKVYAARVDTGTPVYTMAHSSYIFLMSPEGELLEIFRDADPADTLAQRIEQRIAQ
jgi:protein SCO1/2